MIRLTLSVATTMILVSSATAENRIDIVRPDAPALAALGSFPVGVRTLTLTDPGRVDILNVTENSIPTYDRPLTVDIWYPAVDGTVSGTTYETVIRDGQTPTELVGMATRDATPVSDASFPVVVISHGYPGNRYLMSHLGENLASKGYVTVSIDHTDSTYSDQSIFGSTLVNRPLDQRFVLDQMGSADVIGADLAAIADTENAGVIGYSMGGYGALIYGGAGVTQTSVDYTWGAPRGLLAAHLAGSDSHVELTDDPRLKAVVAIGPWGRNRDFWDADGLAGISRPLLLMAGSVDDVSEYPAMRAIFDEATGTTRHLLTFNHANHNAAAPMPAPLESYAPVDTLDFVPFEHYADAVWDNVRMNNIAQHFATAFLDLHLKGDVTMEPYLDLVPISDDGVVALDDEGRETEDHTYWTGFAPRTAVGLRFETKAVGE